MVHTCCVPSCGLSSTNSQVSFHKFTQDKKLQKYWIQLLKLDTVRSRSNPRPFEVCKSAKICSRHFEKGDFRISSKVWRLKSTAVPSIFPWTIPGNAVEERARQCSMEKPAADEATLIQGTLPQNITFRDNSIPKEEQNVNLVTNVPELPQVPQKPRQKLTIKPSEEEDQRPVYQCNSCPYNTIWIFCFDHHILRHQSVSCTDCTIPIELGRSSTPSCRFWGSQIDIIKRHIKTVLLSYRARVQNEDSGKVPTLPEMRKCVACHPCKPCVCNGKQRNPYEVERYECEMCPFRTKYKNSLKQHMAIKHCRPSDIVWFECHMCSYRGRRKGDLEGHVRSKHSDPSDIEWFECHRCSYKSKTKFRLKTHVSAKHSDPSEIDMFDCHMCAYKTKWKNALKGHIYTRHTEPSDIKWFECQMCSYKAKTPYSLKRHICVKHSDPSEWLECKMCSHKSETKHLLEKHVSTEHSDVCLFECHFCSCKTKTKYGLKRHIARQHSRLSSLIK